MKLFNGSSARGVALFVVGALLAQPAVFASPRPITPEKAHARILKRGLGNWVGVELDTGVALIGRITSIDEQSFGLQLHNDPHITQIEYRDVVDLHTGVSSGAFWGILAAGAGGMVALGLIAHHEMSQMPKLPTLPSQPAVP